MVRAEPVVPSSPRGEWLGVTPRLAMALVLLAAVLLTETGAVRNLLRLWSVSPMYSYAYLVPAISLFLAYAIRDRYLARRPTPSLRIGGAAFALWAGLVLFGRLSGIVLVEQLAIVIAVAAIVIVVWGVAHLRAAWFAIAYLLLMVPLWDAFTEPMHLRFQLLSAAIGLRVLDVMGIPAFRQGTFIALPNLTLEVAQACSGVNYLVAVLALALPLAYLYLRTAWRRIVLVLSGMVIAAVSNGLRVALIGVLAYADIGAPLHGPGHVLHGLFVSGIGMAMLLLSLSLLRERPAARPTPALATPPAPGQAGNLHALRPALATLALVVLTATGLAAYRPMPVPLPGTLEDLPLQIGHWVAAPFSQPPHPGWWENADAELRRRYLGGGQSVDVFVAYFAAQEQSREVVGYRSSALHRAAHLSPLSNAASDRVANVTPSTDPGGSIVFWYEVDGRVEADAYTTKLHTAWRALTRRQTNAAAVFVRAAPGSEPVSVDTLTAFANEVHDALAACLPRGPVALVARAAPERTPR